MGIVMAYKNDRYRCFCQIKFDSGERILISIAGAPTPSIKVLRLALAGLIPWQTIWEYNPTMAGGCNAYVEKLMKLFPDTGATHLLDTIRDTLLPCKSINEAGHTLLECEARASESRPSQMPNASEPFDRALLRLANRLRAETGFEECRDVMDAAAIVLTSITTSTLAAAGTDHLPHPMASSVENTSMGACFLAACLSGRPPERERYRDERLTRYTQFATCALRLS